MNVTVSANGNYDESEMTKTKNVRITKTSSYDFTFFYLIIFERNTTIAIDAVRSKIMLNFILNRIAYGHYVG